MPMGVYARTYRPLIERFWSHVEKSDRCWLWTPRPANNDYGRIREQGRGQKLKAHRLSWEIHNGPIPEGMAVLHHCDTPPCVNPAHLFLGTNADNVADKMRKVRQANGERMNLSRLTTETVAAIRARHAAGGITFRALAAEFGIGATTARWVVIRRIWKHVP